MYDVRFRGSKTEKKYKLFISGLSSSVKNRLKDILVNNPYPRSSQGDELCKVEKKGPLYCVEVTGGDRVLYDIINLHDFKAVLIHYAGNEDGERKYLKNIKR